MTRVWPKLLVNCIVSTVQVGRAYGCVTWTIVGLGHGPLGDFGEIPDGDEVFRVVRALARHPGSLMRTVLKRSAHLKFSAQQGLALGQQL